MKLRLTFKTPDVLDQLRDEVEIDYNDSETTHELHLGEIEEKLATWVEYSEYVRIEFDLDNMTATVLKNK